MKLGHFSAFKLSPHKLSSGNYLSDNGVNALIVIPRQYELLRYNQCHGVFMSHLFQPTFQKRSSISVPWGAYL